jgi:prepilin-type N-terminal cleavage/methylation domain-containing protein
MVKDQHQRFGSRRGMTLVEVMVAMGVVTLVVGGLYGSGIMARKVSLFNELSLQVNALVIQKLEEVVALSYEELFNQSADVMESQINSARGNKMYREVFTLAHQADGTVTTNMEESAYIEVHVRGIFVSPLNKEPETRSVSTLVYRP